MFCKKCGKEILEKVAFCPKCGAKIENVAIKNGFEDIHNKMENQEVWRKSIKVKMLGIATSVIAFISLFLNWLKSKGYNDSYNFFELMSEANKAIVCILPIVSIIIYLFFKIKSKSKFSLIGCAGMIATIILFIFIVHNAPHHKYYSYANGFMLFMAATVIVSGLELWE